MHCLLAVQLGLNGTRSVDIAEHCRTDSIDSLLDRVCVSLTPTIAPTGAASDPLQALPADNAIPELG